MNELEDIKLTALLQQLKLDSPKPNFSVRVMNKIFEESSVLEKIKSEKVLGTGFWIIMALFVILMVLTLVLQNSGIGADSQIQNLLPETGTKVSEGYNSFFSKMGSIPLGIGGIFAAFSVLIFLDRFISSNSKVFA